MKKPRRWLLLASATAMLVTLSCRDQSPLAPPSAAITAARPEASLLGNILSATGLLSCSPLPYDSVSQWVGRAGGTISVGPHALTIPPGALSHGTLITAVVPTTNVNVIRFGPQGLVFNQPARLTMSYANCSLLARLLPSHIAYTNDALKILELLPAMDNLLQKTATSDIGHFSGYALAF